MKKLSIIAASVLTVSSLHAGLLGFNTGIGGGSFMNNTPTGTYSDGTNTVSLSDKLNLDGDTSYYAWGYIEHPLPIIPNIRVEMNQDKYKGSTFLTANILGKSFNNTVNSSLDLSSNDVILYWGIPLTSTLSTLTPLIDYDLDFGLGFKKYTGGINIDDTVTHLIHAEQDFSDAMLGYGYLRGRVESFGFGVETSVKYSSYLDNSFSSFLVKADYVIPVTPIIDFGLEAGYKSTSLTLDVDTDNLKIQTDLTTSGLFFGGFIKF